MGVATRAFTPLQLGPLTLKNRFIKSAANENMSRAGLPTAALLQHHAELAAGGVGLTTVAYMAVSGDGRTFPDQLYLHAAAVPLLRHVTDAVHTAGGKISAQITHGGSFVTGRKLAGYAMSASGGWNKAGTLAGNYWQRAMGEADMAQVVAEFVQAAQFARVAGFDAVEIHMGHGYLLNQFISPLSNRRRDGYGGSAENRVRFPARVLAAVKQAVGSDMAVLAKMNCEDGVRGGATVADAIVTARVLQAAGADLLVLSGGRNVESLSFMFGSSPHLPALRAHLRDQPLMRAAVTLQNAFAPKRVFEPLYFWPQSLAIQQAVPDMPMAYLGGVQSLAGAEQALHAGFSAVAMARVLLHDAAFVRKLQSGELSASACDACNGCVATIYNASGTRCIHHPERDAAWNAAPLML